MHKSYAVLLAAPVALLLSHPVNAANTSSLHGVERAYAPDATIGDEVHKQGDYFGYPDEDSVFVVTTGVDRGADFSAPTDYPPERHAVFSEALDSYFVFYEYNDANAFAISGKYWQAVGPIGFWSFEFDVNDGGDDSGRPSAHESDTGVSMAYHRTDDGSGEYDVWFADYDGTSWTNTRLNELNGTDTLFPFLDRSSDGTWMAAYTIGDIADPTTTIGVSTSADGVTWSTANAAVGVQGAWQLPTGAADPSNGDLYVGFQDFHADSPDTDFDICLVRSTDGGMTWSDPQLIAEGVPGGQAALPSVAVDSDHMVHVIYQANLCDSGTLICGYPQTGGTGPAMYANGSFDENNEWVAGAAPSNLNSRENLAGIDPEICGETNLVTMSTDSLTGLPQLGIRHDEGGDELYAAYTQPIYSEYSGEGGNLVCGSWQVYMQKYSNGSWSDRVQVSNITNEQIEAGRASIFPHLTHQVPVSGPGIEWVEMDNAVAPADIMFNRPSDPAVGVGGDTPVAPTLRAVLRQNAPNPFNPSTQISYSLAEAGNVELGVFDAMGRNLRTLVEGEQAAGNHVVRWNGADELGATVPSGVYFYRLTTSEETITRSMVVLK